MKTLEELEMGMELLANTVTIINDLIELRVVESIHYAKVTSISIEVDTQNQLELIKFELQSGHAYEINATDTSIEWIARDLIVKFLVTGEESVYLAQTR